MAGLALGAMGTATGTAAATTGGSVLRTAGLKDEGPCRHDLVEATDVGLLQGPGPATVARGCAVASGAAVAGVPTPVTSDAGFAVVTGPVRPVVTAGRAVTGARFRPRPRPWPWSVLAVPVARPLVGPGRLTAAGEEPGLEGVGPAPVLTGLAT